MTLARHLAALGYGTRREVEALCAQGRVTGQAGRRLRADERLADAPHDEIRVDGAPLDPSPGAVVLLHKPRGLTCSTQDRGPLVYDVLPPRFRRRTPVLAPVGRLDKETTGLLLLTDDGALLHRITSPRSHLPRTYRVTLAAPLRGDEATVFASGTLRLDGERTPLAPAPLAVLGPRDARLVITEGRYHQVRRMFAAVGNHVQALHREALGPLTLGDLPAGAWRVLDGAERARLDDALRAARAAVSAAPPPAP